MGVDVRGSRSLGVLLLGVWLLGACGGVRAGGPTPGGGPTGVAGGEPIPCPAGGVCTEDPPPEERAPAPTEGTTRRVLERSEQSVRVCSFLGHHGYGGLTVGLDPSCGERSAVCRVARWTPARRRRDPVPPLDVAVEVAELGPAVCDEPAYRPTSSCVLPATQADVPPGVYPPGVSLLPRRARVPVRINGAAVEDLVTDEWGHATEQCWSVPAAGAPTYTEPAP